MEHASHSGYSILKSLFIDDDDDDETILAG